MTTLTVNSAGDIVADDGQCTLREAITAANSDTASGTTPGECAAGSGMDTITLALSLPVTITLNGTLPSITSAMTIAGPGIDALTINGNNSLRVLQVGGSGTLALSGLTIANGQISSDGAGIYNAGTLTITNSALTGNIAAAPASGGGIYNAGGTLTVIDSLLFNNHAYAGSGIYIDGGTATLVNSSISENGSSTYFSTHGAGIFNTGALNVVGSRYLSKTISTHGGGIYNSGVAYVTDSLFSGNNSQTGGGISNIGSLTVTHSTISNNFSQLGGGISNYIGKVILISSTLSGNFVFGYGGAIGNDNGGMITVTNSTLSGNTGGYGGGGIWNRFGGTITVVNSTLSNNSASTGGSIYNDSGGNLILRNTIVANSLSGGDCYNFGMMTDGGNNILEDNTCGFTGGSDPNLGPLADNGGAVQTHALLPGSPAIDAANPIYCPATDQRGVHRVGVCDIGAYEAEPILNMSKSVSEANPSPGQLITYTIVISNSGGVAATDGAVIDNLPAGLTVAGPVILTPLNAGTTGALPTLVTGLAITAGKSVTITFPVTVNIGVPNGMIITNTATVTSAEVTTPRVASTVITVTAPSGKPILRLAKSVSRLNPSPGQRMTYTLVISNSGTTVATGGIVVDAIPSGLTLAGSAILTPTGAGTVGAPPTLVTGLILIQGQSVTVTFPVTVNTGLAFGTVITNYATISSTEVITPVTTSVAVTVTAPHRIYLPVVTRSP